MAKKENPKVSSHLIRNLKIQFFSLFPRNFTSFVFSYQSYNHITTEFKKTHFQPHSRANNYLGYISFALSLKVEKFYYKIYIILRVPKIILFTTSIFIFYFFFFFFSIRLRLISQHYNIEIDQFQTKNLDNTLFLTHDLTTTANNINPITFHVICAISGPYC